MDHEPTRIYMREKESISVRYSLQRSRSTTVLVFELPCLTQLLASVAS